MQPQGDKWLVLPPSQAIQRPTIDPRLEELNAVARSTECLRHLVLSIEFWISPSGRLRQWVALNVCLAAFLLVPAIVLMPIIGLILHEVDGWLSMLVSIALKLISLSALVLLVMLVVTQRKHAPSSSKGSSRRR